MYHISCISRCMHTHDLSVQVLTRVLFGKDDIAVSVYLNDFSFSLFANCFSEMRLTLQSTRYVVLPRHRAACHGVYLDATNGY